MVPRADVGTTAGTVCAGDDGRLLTTDQETQIAAAAVLCATATVCMVDASEITTADTATFTCTPDPVWVAAAVEPAGTIQLYRAGSTAVGTAQALVAGTVDIAVLGSALGEGNVHCDCGAIPAAPAVADVDVGWCRGRRLRSLIRVCSSLYCPRPLVGSRASLCPGPLGLPRAGQAQGAFPDHPRGGIGLWNARVSSSRGRRS